MNATILLHCSIALLVALGTSRPLRAADETLDKKPAREEFKNLPPEERAGKFKAWREKNAGTNGEAFQRKREELRNLTPEEREAKRQEFCKRLDQQLEELRKKKADGSITIEEAKRLERTEQLRKRFDQAGPGFRPQTGTNAPKP